MALLGQDRLPDARLLAVVAAGGVLGALSRYGLQRLFPHAASGFGWATFGINVAGCLLIGIFVAAAAQSRRAPRLARPFLVTGVLGGFTTFSTYIVDMQRALVAGAPRVALLYGGLTLTVALTAAWAGVQVAELMFRRSGRAAAGPPEDALPAGTGVQAFLGTGFCGTLTTYTTFSYETVILYRWGARTLSLLYAVASVLAGFGAAYCGMALAQAIQ